MASRTSSRAAGVGGAAALVVFGLAVGIAYPLSQDVAAGSVLLTLVVGLVLGAGATFLPQARRGLGFLALVVVGGLVTVSVDQDLAAAWLGGVFAGIGLGLAWAGLRPRTAS